MRFMGNWLLAVREKRPADNPQGICSPPGRLRTLVVLRTARFSLSRMCLDGTTSHGSSIFTLVKTSDDKVGLVRSEKNRTAPYADWNWVV